MSVVPTGSLYGPSLAASADGAASFEGLLQGLTTLPKALSGMGQRQGLALDVYNNRVKAQQGQALHAADLVSKLTYGGGNALTQALAGQKPMSGGPGGATGGIAPTPIHAMQAEARRLSELRALANDQQSRRNYGLSSLGRALTPEAALEGLANPAEELGLPAGMVVRPEAMARIAHLLNSGDSSAGAALTALGLPADTKAEDLTGMSQRLQEYQSDIAGRLGKKQEGESKLDLAGRALLMRERLLQMGYDSDNIEDVAMELAKLPDEAARFAIDEMGRPTKFGHEMRLAKRRSVKTIINKYVGLENKGGGGGSRSSSGRGGASELGKQLRSVDADILAINTQAAKPVEKGGGMTASLTMQLERLLDERERIKSNWDAAFLTPVGPATDTGELGERVKKMWESGADFTLAWETLKNSGNLNSDQIFGVLTQMGTRKEWNSERSASAGTAGSDFTSWYGGLAGKKQRDFDDQLVNAANSVLSKGGSREDYLRMAKSQGGVAALAGADDYLGKMFDMVDKRVLQPSVVGGGPRVSSTTPVDWADPVSVPTTSSVNWADPVDSVRQAVEQDIAETAKPRVTTTVSSLDEYKRGRADEARSRRDHPSTWGERAPREVPVGPYANAEMFFDMVEDDVLSGVVRDPVVVLKEADKIALAFERENSSVRHSSKSYRAGAGSGRVTPGEPAPEIVKAREFLKAAVALSTRGGSRDYKSIYNERDFLPDVDPDQRGLNFSRPVKGGIKNNVTGRKTYFRSFLGEGGAPERPSHDRYERERLAAAAKDRQREGS